MFVEASVFRFDFRFRGLVRDLTATPQNQTAQSLKLLLKQF